MPQSSFGYLGMGVETTPGVNVPPTKFLPVKDVDFPVENEFIEIREIRGSRQAYQTYDGPVRPDVNFTSSFYPSGPMGVLMRGLFGSSTSAPAGTSTTAFTHTFQDAASLPSLTFERSDTSTAGGVIVQRVPGCKIESIGFSCAYGEDVDVSVNAQGLSFPSSPASRPATIAYPTVNPFIFRGASVTINGVANDLFKNIDFEFTNTLERQETLRGTREAYRIFEGGLECSLSGTLAFEDVALYNSFRDASTFSVKVSFVSGIADAAPTPDVMFGATFDFPSVQISSFGIPFSAGEVIEADVDFQVKFDNATSRLVTATLTNLDPAGTYGT